MVKQTTLKQNHLVIAFVYKDKNEVRSVHLLLFIAEVGKLLLQMPDNIYFGAYSHSWSQHSKPCIQIYSVYYLSKTRMCTPTTSGVSETTACPQSPIADDPCKLYHLSPPLPPLVSNLAWLTDDSPCEQLLYCTSVLFIFVVAVHLLSQV